MRALALLAAAALAFSAPAQDKAPAPKKKKPAAKQVVHRKPTPEQIRKFDKLEKKQEAPQKK